MLPCPLPGTDNATFLLSPYLRSPLHRGYKRKTGLPRSEPRSVFYAVDLRTCPYHGLCNVEQGRDLFAGVLGRDGLVPCPSDGIKELERTTWELG